MIIRHKIGYTTLALFAITFLTIATTQAAPPSFGTAEDEAFAEALWNKLHAANLMGKNTITVVPYVGRDPHGMILETLTTTLEVMGKTGQVIVKKNYGGKGITRSKVVRDRKAWLKATTVMFKMEKGYNPAGKDWFWVKYLANGKRELAPNKAPKSGRVAGCIACHTAAVGGEMVYTVTPDYLDN